MTKEVFPWISEVRDITIIQDYKLEIGWNWKENGMIE